MVFFRNFFLNNWERKVISLFLAIVIWMVVNHSLTTSKVLENVPVRLINIPAGMTVEGLQPNGMLSKKISLTMQGNKTELAEIVSNDIEIVLDAMDKSDDWLATITRKNLLSLNPDINLSKAIKRVVIQRLPINFTRLVTEKIPVVVTQPIGEAPRDYQFLDVWPYRLSMTVSGPEEVIKQLKAKGMNLTFNLNDITRTDLEAEEYKSDEVSFFVPDTWKQISIPSLSDRPFNIDDPQANELRIDFVRSDLHPIAKAIPITLFFPPEHSLTLNPETYSLALGGFVQQFHGIYLLKKSLYAKGVSHLFVELVQDMLEISILLSPKTEKKQLDWSVQFLNPRVLEDKYVSILMSDDGDRSDDPSFIKRREEYLRGRFRHYMNRFQLYKSDREKFDLKVELQDQKIVVEESPHENNRHS
jgi:YbbR domain-containing protein